MKETHTSYSFTPIAYIDSPFKEKFGIPRQPRLTPSIKSTIVFSSDFKDSDMLEGLQSATHLWIIFVFSECFEQGWKAKVRPPRLGGNKKIGVFATRAPYRPNPIGISAVELISIDNIDGTLSLTVSSADLLHNTPVLDIKPYVPYSDRIREAKNSIANAFDEICLPIFFSAQAQKACESHLLLTGESLTEQIEQILQCDPRPAYQKTSEKIYGINLYHWNIQWRVRENSFEVLNIDPTRPKE